jgi:hypothetical protein
LSFSKGNVDDPTSILGRVEDFAFLAHSDPLLLNNADNTHCINSLHASSTAHRREKEKSMSRFLGFMSSHPNEKIRLLVQIIADSKQIDETEHRLVILVRGLKSLDEQGSLKSCLVIFAVNMFKLGIDEELIKSGSGKEKADAQCAPSSLGTCVRHAFAFLH